MSCVYFVRGGEHVKIGHTRNFAKRLGALANGSPVPLELIGAMPGGRDEERELHRRFAHLRGPGEWFRATGELLAFVSSLPKMERLPMAEARLSVRRQWSCGGECALCVPIVAWYAKRRRKKPEWIGFHP